MIRTVHIENFKSVRLLDLELNRVNVLIGENGCGKSNILESVAVCAAASQNKLDNEFLSSRGLRVTEPRFMRSAFACGESTEPTQVRCQGDDDVDFRCSLSAEKDAGPYSFWDKVGSAPSPKRMQEFLSRHPSKKKKKNENGDSDFHFDVVNLFLSSAGPLARFLIYSPENSALRVFQSEGQILPLGIRGEGLFAHLKVLSQESPAHFKEIQERLKLLDWFEHFVVPDDLTAGDRKIRISDRYLKKGDLFDQRSANEGFLFLLFYFTLFISPNTPSFFAIDNVDASLNPKLCRYDEVSRPFRKKQKLLEQSQRNPSFQIFVNELNIKTHKQA